MTLFSGDGWRSSQDHDGKEVNKLKKEGKNKKGRKAKTFTKLAVFIAFFAAIMILNIATALAQVQSHRLSEVSNIDTDLDLNVYQLNASQVNSTDAYFSSNVGIGIASPATPLEVVGTGIANHMRLTNTNTSEVGPAVYFNAANRDWVIFGSNPVAGAGDQKLVFRDYSGASDRMVIDSSGNVGIGTTDPGARLDVAGSINATGDICISGSNCLSTAGGGVAGNVSGAGSANYVAVWDDAENLTYDSDLYWDNSTDRLGIGTTSPYAKLDVDDPGGIAVWGNGSFVGVYGCHNCTGSL
ncbi:hypothetical protein KY349_02070, partial [Candidatus Woesearchaeota archaeon]|nr:hypothetical protein [Candidatus Woesearchaeota archaeon]